MDRYKENNVMVDFNKLTKQDLSILKYYKEGHGLSGFEKGWPWENLERNGYLDGDLELTSKGWYCIKTYQNWDSVVSFKNETVIEIKPILGGVK